MRHLKAGRKFGRTSAHRKALFRNLVTALLDRERIRTTLPKAKELRSKVEKTITLGKKGTLHARRQALKLVTRKDTLQKIFGTLAERYAARNGGYTRIIRIGNRRGDDAPMAFIELVDREGGTPETAGKQEKAQAKPAKGAKAGNVKTDKKKTPEKKAAKAESKDKKPAVKSKDGKAPGKKDKSGNDK